MTTTAPAIAPRTRPPSARVGAIAALTKAATYVVGFVVMATYLGPRGYVDAVSDPAGSLAFLRENEAAMYTWYLVLYLLGGLALAGLVVALDERLRPASDLARRSAGAVGLLWAGLLLASGLVALVGQPAVIGLTSTDPALATATWSSVSVVQDALGGGIEIVGAVWVALVSACGLRSGLMGRGLAALGFGVAVAGAGTLLPAAADAAGSLFGLGFIVWFAWVGLALLRQRA